MSRRTLFRALPFVSLALIAALATPMLGVNASTGTTSKVVSLQTDKEPITAYITTTVEVTTLDPQLAEDETAIIPIENLFLGLTDVDPKTQDIRPEVATKWTQNDAGDVWTFTLRNDIPWVSYDPKTKKATQVGTVTAGDFEYGIKRSCDPRLASYYGSISASMIKGCDLTYGTKPEDFKDSDLDQVEVKALSDTQLQITLQGDLPYFESVSPLWMLRAVPRKTIEQFGSQWTDPGNIVTDGPFMVDTFVKGVNRIFVKNPLYPADVEDNYGGNIERMYYSVVKDGGTVYSKFQNNEVDATGIPRGEQAKILADPELSKQVVSTYDLSVSYFGFAYDKPPFDNVHARRAFSAVIDRKALVADLLGGRGAPMAHFMPPGIFGSVGINEVGIGDPKNLGFDPEYAKQEFALAGYKDCANFPTITIVTEGGSLAEYLQNQIKTHLGCDPSKITIQQAEFQVLLQSIKPTVPTPQRPNMWTAAWGPDYLDAQNWMHDVLGCKVENPFKRDCGDIDKKIDAASRELDSKKRADLYRQLEEDFFGKDGEFVIAPLFTTKTLLLYKPWYTGLFDTDALLGGAHWDTRHIDQAAQLAARGNAQPPQQDATPTPETPDNTAPSA
ncbi:MAG: peptide ABC transporter substrate-binding protein [Chloroflexota bacterium]